VLAAGPRLIIADEPTTALDVTVQAQILTLLAKLKSSGTGLLLISHDLAVVARLADRIAVMNGGRIIEDGPAAAVLAEPRHAYTRALIAAAPDPYRKRVRLSPTRQRTILKQDEAQQDSVKQVVLAASGVSKRFRVPDGGWHAAVDNVSFELRTGETLGVVGESGSGKSTLARIVLGLLEPDRGAVRLGGEPWTGLPERRRRTHRDRIQSVPQDPLGSFDPRYTVGRTLDEAVMLTGLRGQARRTRIAELLDQVGLTSNIIGRRPLELSGGQRQRVAIARALASSPDVLICDEPVSALDVSIQAQILDLLADLRGQLALAMLFISHDLGVIRHVSDRVAVLQDGRIVEAGTADKVFEAPAEAYTRQLLAAVPRLAPG
jgi:peptide/nickel transport system ATP-binding protein